MNRNMHLAAALAVLMASGAAFAQDPADDVPMVRDISEPSDFSVVHGDLEKGNADIVTTFPAGMTLPTHSHTTAERMVLLSGELHLTYDGHETLILKPGSYAYGPAKLVHGGACVSDVPCVLFIATELPFDQIPDMAQMDADDDGRWSLAEFQGGWGDFDAMDSNRDQMLSSDEFPGVEEPISRAEFHAMVAASFKRGDRDGDGFIDADELAESMRQRAASASGSD